MSKIIPFKAIRAPRHLAHLLVTRPYYTYAKHVMDAKLESNPFSFLHIINPEHGLSDRHATNSSERFSKVYDKFQEFLDLGYLVQEPLAMFYVYRQSLGDKSYTGLICGADVKEYDNDQIKKHESTLTSREELFVKYLEITGFNAEPVLISHQSDAEINEFLKKICAGRPEYEFSTTDKLKHELWLVPQSEEDTIKSLYGKIENLYIADGHHRSASSSRLAALKRSQGCKADDPSQFFLSLLMDEDTLEIFPFHRVVRDLNNLEDTQFLEAIAESFDITPTMTFEPTNDKELVMVLKNERYLLKPLASKVDFSHPTAGLSTQYLTDLILEPILHITDQKTSDRIEFISGFYGVEQTLRKLDKYPQ